VALVPEDADELGGERLVQQAEDRIAVRVVIGGDRAALDVLPRPLAQRLDVGQNVAIARAARRRRGLGRFEVSLSMELGEVLGGEIQLSNFAITAST
jgi:hypothetical protein